VRALGRLHVARGRVQARNGRWADAARAFEAALRCDDRDAGWHAELGQARVRTRQWEGAIDAYEAALARDDRNANWHAQLGRARVRAQRWAAAADAYEAAARRGNNPAWLLRAAQARQRANNQAPTGPRGDAAPGVDRDRERQRALAVRRAQRARLAERLSRDPTATELDRLLLAAHPERFSARRKIARTIARRIDEIRSGAQGASRAVPDARPRIFVFWAQGIEKAPPVVRRCHEELRRFHSDDEIVLLDSSCIDEYVTLPAHIVRRLGEDWTKLSDLLRLELLSSYGGVWMDATCLPRVRLLGMLPDLLRPSGFFAFTARRARLASWFLASEPDHYLVAMMREGHYAYWRRYDRVIDYYVFHHIFEALYHVDERFHDLWDATPKLPRSAASQFKNQMLGPYDPARFTELLNGCFIHKLSYKSDVNALRRDTMLARLVRDGAPADSPSTELRQL
jgi:tetratricopeptide (TPR) repeat protein